MSIRNLQASICYLFMLWIAVDLKAADSSRKLLASREIFLPEKAYQYLIEDGPTIGIQFYQNNGIWILTKKNVWVWSLTSRQVQKIPLIHDDNILSHLLIKDNKVFVASDKYLFIIQSSPFQIKRFVAHSSGRTINLHQSNANLYWVRTPDTATIQPINTTLKIIHRHNLPDDTSYAQFDMETNSLLYVSNNTLFKLTYSDFINQTQSITQLSNMTRGFIPSGDRHLFMFTAYNILRIHASGSIVQTVPVASQRKLVLVAADSIRHAYLFDDRLLEIKNLQDKATEYFYLNPGRVKKAQKLTVSHSLVAFIGDDKPRIFQLESR